MFIRADGGLHAKQPLRKYHILQAFCPATEFAWSSSSPPRVPLPNIFQDSIPFRREGVHGITRVIATTVAGDGCHPRDGGRLRFKPIKDNCFNTLSSLEHQQAWGTKAKFTVHTPTRTTWSQINISTNYKGNILPLLFWKLKLFWTFNRIVK